MAIKAAESVSMVDSQVALWVKDELVGGIVEL